MAEVVLVAAARLVCYWREQYEVPTKFLRPVRKLTMAEVVLVVAARLVYYWCEHIGRV